MYSVWGLSTQRRGHPTSGCFMNLEGTTQPKAPFNYINSKTEIYI